MQVLCWVPYSVYWLYARSIFNELESQDKLKVGFWNVRGGILIAAADSFSRLKTRHSYLRLGEGRAAVSFAKMLTGPVLFMFNIVLLFNFYGPLICIGVSSWRLRQRDYHGHGADDRGAGWTFSTPWFFAKVCSTASCYSLPCPRSFSNLTSPGNASS